MDNQEWSIRRCTEEFGVFFTACIHTLLYLRGVYPKTLFTKTQLYNTLVWQSRHPKLSGYIAKVVESCVAEIQSGHVSRIAVCLLSESQRVLERFVFSTESLPTISSVFLDRPAVAQNGRNVTEAESVESLRAAIVRFIRAAEGLKPLPSGTTWCVRLSFKADHDRPGNYHSWIAAQQETDEKEWLLHSRTIPVQNINIGPVLFEAWVEA